MAEGLGLQAQEMPAQQQGLGLKPFDVNDSSTFGLRLNGTPKGYGFFGMLPSQDPSQHPGTYSSELSYNTDVQGRNLLYPILVPTLTREEIDHILSGKEPTDAMHDKAIDHALMRIKNWQSPFAEPHERYPLPDYATK